MHAASGARYVRGQRGLLLLGTCGSPHHALGLVERRGCGGEQRARTDQYGGGRADDQAL